MGEVLPLPNRGEVFLDPRGQGRSLRVSWHRDENTLVLSLWQLGQCRATFRLLTEDVPDLVRALVAGLSDGLVQQRQTLQQLATAAAPTVLVAEPPTVLVAEPPTVVADEPPTVPVAPPPAGEADVTVPATGAKPDAGGPGVSEKKPPPTPREQPPPVIFQAPPDPA